MKKYFVFLLSAAAVMFVGLTITNTAEAELIMHLKLDETSGLTAADSADSHDGALNGAMTDSDWVTGKVGGALDFDGVDDYVLANDHADLDFGSGNFSVSFWVKKQEYGDSYHNCWGVNKWENAASLNSEWSVGIGSPSIHALFRIKDGTTTYEANSGTKIYADDTWHHLVGVRDGGSIHFYIDKVLKASNTDVGTASVNNAGTDLYIAASRGGTTFATDGLFDDVQIYDQALSATEVAYMFDNPGAIIPEPSTLALLLFGGFVLLIARRFRKR